MLSSLTSQLDWRNWPGNANSNEFCGNINLQSMKTQAAKSPSSCQSIFFKGIDKFNHGFCSQLWELDGCKLRNSPYCENSFWSSNIHSPKVPARLHPLIFKRISFTSKTFLAELILRLFSSFWKIEGSKVPVSENCEVFSWTLEPRVPGSTRFPSCSIFPIFLSRESSSNIQKQLRFSFCNSDGSKLLKKAISNDSMTHLGL